MKGKVVIVTGSATGIGKAIAIRAAERGARVMLTDKDGGGMEAVAQRIGEPARSHVADLVDPDSPAAIVSATIETFGRIDGLVNNAAYIPRSNIETTSLDMFEQVMAVNVRAPLFLIKAALPHLTESGGSVLNIGSINAYAGEPNMMIYSVSKGALMTMTRNLGDSLLRDYGVRVNQINPGWVLTENEIRYQVELGMPTDWPERLPREFNPSGTLISPDTIAEAALFWLSDISRPVSASVVEMEQFPLIGRNPAKSVEK
jgi:NAD(P)-dependent dehydrogenase (short-subunit alcohol dehydrogenase family)